MSTSVGKSHRMDGRPAKSGGRAEEGAFQSRSPVADAQGFYWGGPDWYSKTYGRSG